MTQLRWDYMKLTAISQVKNELAMIETFIHHSHYFNTRIVLNYGSSRIPRWNLG